jgi:hypothetical protein
VGSADGIFMIRSGQLAVLRDSPYESEDVLQRALADFPEVLAGGATTDEGNRRLLLIRREKGIPTTQSGSSTFSLDHLFVDPTGVPVVVEVKRSSDTRIRREVVGQMLDYAANGVKYWPVAELRADFEASCAARGEDAEQLIEDVAAGTGAEEFWKQVEQNLRSGHVRMVFVADRLPDELVRVIEFLNEQMSPAEVLGVEVQQFTDGVTQVLVPRLVGATASAKAAKERATGTAWNDVSMLEAAEERCTEHEVELARALLDHAARSGTKLSWGKGITPGVSGWYLVNGTSRAVWTLNIGSGTGKAHVSLWFPEIQGLLSEAQFKAFVERLRTIESFRQDIDSKAHKYPVGLLAQLTTDDISNLLGIVQALAHPADHDLDSTVDTAPQTI